MESNWSRGDNESQLYHDIKRIWRAFAHADPYMRCPRFLWKTGFDPEFNPELDTSQQNEALLCLVNELLEQADDPEGHVRLLNSKLAGFLWCSFDASSTNAVNNAFGMLSRLPQLPLELPLEEFTHLKSQNVNDVLPPAYTSMAKAGEERLEWGQLKVVSLLDGCTIRLALAIANRPNAQDASLGENIRFYLDRIVELLDMLTNRRFSYVPKSRYARAILTAYLWSTWQRSVTIFLSGVLK